MASYQVVLIKNVHSFVDTMESNQFSCVLYTSQHVL